MSSVLEKSWAAVHDDLIIAERDDRDELLSVMRRRGLDPDDYDIVALPKPHFSVFV